MRHTVGQPCTALSTLTAVGGRADSWGLSSLCMRGGSTWRMLIDLAHASRAEARASSAWAGAYASTTHHLQPNMHIALTGVSILQEDDEGVACANGQRILLGQLNQAVVVAIKPACRRCMARHGVAWRGVAWHVQLSKPAAARGSMRPARSGLIRKNRHPPAAAAMFSCVSRLGASPNLTVTRGLTERNLHRNRQGQVGFCQRPWSDRT